MKKLLRMLAVISIAVLIVGGMSLAAGCAAEEEPESPPVEEPEEPAEEPTEEPVAEGEDILEGACTQCHDTTRIFVQPEYVDWTAIINTMEEAHGAVLTDEEKAAVAEFLESRTPSEGEQVIAGKCTECHDLTRIYSQPYGSDWQGILERMVEVHGAALTEEEQAAVIDYLENR